MFDGTCQVVLVLLAIESTRVQFSIILQCGKELYRKNSYATHTTLEKLGTTGVYYVVRAKVAPHDLLNLELEIVVCFN